MKTTLLLLTLTLALASCTTPAAWRDTPNPLDQPGDNGTPSAAWDLHRENLRAITRNPGYR